MCDSQGAEDSLTKVRASELHRRKIYCYPDIPRPRQGITANLPYYPFPQWNNQAGFFGYRYEFRRGYHPAIRMMPADKRFEGDHLVAPHRNDRLVEHLELLLGYGGA